MVGRPNHTRTSDSPAGQAMRVHRGGKPKGRRPSREQGSTSCDYTYQYRLFSNNIMFRFQRTPIIIFLTNVA